MSALGNMELGTLRSGIAAPPEQGAAAPPPRELERPATLTALFVDDHESARSLMRRILTGAGYRALLAGDGVEALEVLQRERVDVIIADIMMPRMDGYRLCQAVRRDERFKELPFIVYTANYASPADEKLALDLGADAFLCKPAAAETIRETLRRVTRQPRPVRPAPALAMLEPAVLQEYSDRLVAKLEARNAELEQRNEVLRESEARYRLLADYAEDFVTLHDTEGRRLYVSPSYYRVTGWTPEDLERTDWRTRVHPDDLAVIEQTRAANLAGTTTTIEHRFRCQDGRWRWAEARCKPVCGPDGRVQQLLVWSRDVTQRRHLETLLRQSQKMEAIGLLAGGIAHDFNNILGAILGNAELARSLPAGNPAAWEYLDSILKASRRASDLVRQILAFSRQQTAKRQPMQLHAMVREALQLMRASLPAAVELQTNLTVTPTVLADPSELHQVTMNLCTNAWHALQGATGRIAVELAETDVTGDFARQHPDLHPGRYVRLTVADNGCGMDPATMSRIFDPFFTTKPVGQGTGLGLSVVLGIVKSHDGGIVVTSQPGQGATFALYFPVFETELVEAPAEPQPIPRGQGQHILFVDDEEPLAQLGVTVLERLGYRVTALVSAPAALATFQAQPAAYDLVVTDLNMPGVSGADLAEKMLTLRPQLPVILTTGFNATMTPATARELGFRELLPKPYGMRTLGEAVHRVLNEPKPA